MMRVFVIGIAGTIASGKETLKEVLKKNVDAYYITLSAAIRGEIEKKKREFSRNTMQDMGDELRQKYGTFVLAKVSTEFMPREKPVLVVDGIKNPGEAEWLRKTYGEDFVLIGMDAPVEARFQHAMKRGRNIDAKTMEDFVLMDERDQGKGEPVTGQQVRKCIDMADVKIQYDGDPAKIEAQLQDVFARIHRLKIERLK